MASLRDLPIICEEQRVKVRFASRYVFRVEFCMALGTAGVHVDIEWIWRIL